MAFNAIKKMIDSLFRKNDEFELEPKFNKDIFSFGDGMYHAYDVIDDLVRELPIRNLSYGIRDFTASIADDRYSHRCTDHNIYLNKESYKKYDLNKLTELDVTFTVISKCLDNKFWKFEIKTYFIYNCFTNAYDSDILVLSTMLANGFVTDMNLNNITYDGFIIDIPFSHNIDRLTSNHFTGYTRTYGDQEYTMLFSINDTVDTKNPGEFLTDSVDSEIQLDKVTESDTIKVSDISGNGEETREKLLEG